MKAFPAARFRDAERVIAGALRGESVALAVFLWLVATTLVSAVKYPFHPGWDFHFHLMSSEIVARRWLGDAFLRANYLFTSPLDANTLLYSLLFPLQLVMRPLWAYGTGLTLFYFVGYPVACAFALRMLQRPLWGAVLAFPMAYGWSWAYGGFAPFLTAAPFFVLSIALMHRILVRPTRRIALACAATAALTFLAHAHVYAWLMAVLCTVTLLELARVIVVDLPRDPRAASLRLLTTGARALAVVLPSLLLFGRWYWRTHHGANAGAAPAWARSVDTWKGKVSVVPNHLVNTFDDRDYLLFGALVLICMLCWLLSASPRRPELPTFEVAFVLTAASYFFLPSSIDGQGIANRHVDLAAWLLPLVVYRARPVTWLRRFAIAGLLVGFTHYRLQFLREKLATLQTEFAGLLEITRDCPNRGRPAFLAYATMGENTPHFNAYSVHQAHETLAAMCRMDTPVYDPTDYAHSVLPVRYRGKPPVPITLIVNKPKWYEHPGLWTSYEYVLVHNWQGRSEDMAALASRAELVKSSGGWMLFRRVAAPP